MIYLFIYLFIHL